MRVLAINGSARKNGNTAILIKYVLKEVEREGIETELIELAGRHFKGCSACYQCFKLKNLSCAIEEDEFNSYFKRMVEADGIILGSPTYITDVTSNMKALIERASLVSRANGEPLSRKVGAAVIAVRRGGAIHAFDTLNHFFLLRGMIVPGSIYWNIGIGREIGDVERDEEGIKTMEALGKNIAWLLKKIKG